MDEWRGGGGGEEGGGGGRMDTFAKVPASVFEPEQVAGWIE